MFSRPLAALALAAAVSFLSAAGPAQAAPADDPDASAWTQLAQTYTATGMYVYEPFATSGGYQRTDQCVPTKGYHYLNPAYLGSVDPATPAVLLYEDELGDRELVGVKWIVEDKGQTAPTLSGQTFDTGRLPGYYTLHAWIHKTNRS